MEDTLEKDALRHSIKIQSLLGTEISTDARVELAVIASLIATAASLSNSGIAGRIMRLAKSRLNKVSSVESKVVEGGLDLEIDDAVYSGNLGFVELTKYYKMATSSQSKDMDKVIRSGNWEKFKKLILSVLGIKLEDTE